jgi:hypothetical protein
MYVCKDIYLYILDFVDDKTIFSMLSVNREFYNEKYFEFIARKKYPLLIKFRDPRFESWKSLFLRMGKHIYKIDLMYGIPYIPTIDYNPERFYRLFRNLILEKGAIYDFALSLALKCEDKKIARLMIQKGATNNFIIL